MRAEIESLFSKINASRIGKTQHLGAGKQSRWEYYNHI